MTALHTAALSMGALLALSGLAAAQIVVDQDAERNRLLVNQQGQTGSAPEKDRVFTTGNDRNSIVHVQQRGAETDAVTATQTGETNTINARQRAEDNTIAATQTGESNTARVRQRSTN